MFRHNLVKCSAKGEDFRLVTECGIGGISWVDDPVEAQLILPVCDMSDLLKAGGDIK